MKNWTDPFVILLVLFAPFSSHAQLVYAAPANFGGRVGTGLFVEQNGQIAALPTGLPEHNHPQQSANRRLVVFSSPDGVEPGLQVPPSSDIYIFDRVSNRTRAVVDHVTIVSPNGAEVQTFLPVSTALSPNNQLLAYGVMLTRRQGLANPRSTKELNIARSSDGVILSNPTFGRGPVSDAFQAEFVGISWDPGGDSFVTPTYVQVPGKPQQLPAIVRYRQNPGDGSWAASEVLSEPRYLDNQFPIAAVTQVYPVVSPSGVALAYFSVSWPDVFGMQTGVVAQLVVADASGNNRRVLATFQQALFPVGLAWSPDGNTLVASLAPQTFFGTAFLPSAQREQATAFNVAFADGTTSQRNSLQGAYSPSFGSPLHARNLSNARLQLRQNANGGLVLSAMGVDPNLIYTIESSGSLGTGIFGPPQSFTGAQLLNGVPVQPPTPARFFRIIAVQ